MTSEKQKISQEEYEKKIIELAKTGITCEKIGEALRKTGIHPQEFDKKISRVLKEKGVYVSPDAKNVQEKLERITAHCEKSKQDKKAKREKGRIFAQNRKFRKYYQVE